jgi:hypothetical protein
MNRSGRFDRDSILATGAKAASVLLVVAVIALFTTHAPLPTGELALVPQAAVQQGASESSTIAPPGSRTATEAAKRGAVRGPKI